MVDSATQREEPFEGIGDVSLDLLRRHTAVKSRNQNNGNIDGRKHVYRHLHDAGEAQDAKKKTQNGDEIRIFYREPCHNVSWSIPGTRRCLRPGTANLERHNKRTNRRIVEKGEIK